jgi:hypothetical protein
MCYKEIGLEVVNWIYLAQDMGQCRSLVKILMKMW